MNKFTIEELTIIKMYASPQLTRLDLLGKLMEACPLVDDRGLSALLQNMVQKLKNMSEDDFANVDLSETLI